MTIQTPPATKTRAEHLREATKGAHDRLDKAIMAAKPFENTENYLKFLRVQYAFHSDVAPLYTDPAAGEHITGLPALSRHAAIVADIRALGGALPATGTPAAAGLPLPEALGWLYVVEGSNLGAAFLFKAALKMGLSADHGASHLAEAPEGRAAHWRSFKEALNAAPLSKAEEARSIAGAVAAFDRVRALVALELPLAP